MGMQSGAFCTLLATLETLLMISLASNRESIRARISSHIGFGPASYCSCRSLIYACTHASCIKVPVLARRVMLQAVQALPRLGETHLQLRTCRPSCTLGQQSLSSKYSVVPPTLRLALVLACPSCPTMSTTAVHLLLNSRTRVSQVFHVKSVGYA